MKTLAKQSHPNLAAASPAFACHSGRVQAMRLPLGTCILFPRDDIPNYEPSSSGQGPFPSPLLEFEPSVKGGAAPLDQHCPRDMCAGAVQSSTGEPKPGQHQLGHSSCWCWLCSGSCWHMASHHHTCCPVPKVSTCPIHLLQPQCAVH